MCKDINGDLNKDDEHENKVWPSQQCGDGPEVKKMFIGV